ncbi:MAG: FAD-dependent oxidoreductase [Pirellulales bacterium]
MTDKQIPIAILGAGPAGLGAALCLARRRQFDVTVFEQNSMVGGNAGSFDLEGLRVDYGSHRLHPACSSRVLSDIRSLVGDDLLTRPRHGRIRLRGRWVHFPLKPLDLAISLPPSFAIGAIRDAVFKKRSHQGPETFATELEKGLGKTICRDFYFPYARKIWGVSPEDLDAEQARRRVSANSLTKIIRKVMTAVPGLKSPTSGKFFYPKKGFGQISDSYYDAAVQTGAKVKLGCRVSKIEVGADGVESVSIECDHSSEKLPSQFVLSTIPLPNLVQAIHPHAPAEVISSISELKYRAMILIYLVLSTDQFTQFDSHYFPGSEVSITRLSEPKNYSLKDLPGTTVLCAELPCSLEDQVWSATDDELQSLVEEDLSRVGIPLQSPVRKVVTRRLPNAYPIYTQGYRRHFDRLDGWVGNIRGLVSLGRQGLFAHDNTHHTLAMAYAASECITPNGLFDNSQWKDCRLQFESHVVED